jgi:hypothetical protein
MLRPSYGVKKPYSQPAAQTPEETGSVPVKENIAASTGIIMPLRPVIPFMS